MCNAELKLELATDLNLSKSKHLAQELKLIYMMMSPDPRKKLGVVPPLGVPSIRGRYPYLWLLMAQFKSHGPQQPAPSTLGSLNFFS